MQPRKRTWARPHLTDALAFGLGVNGHLSVKWGLSFPRRSFKQSFGKACPRVADISSSSLQVAFGLTQIFSLSDSGCDSASDSVQPFPTRPEAWLPRWSEGFTVHFAYAISL